MVTTPSTPTIPEDFAIDLTTEPSPPAAHRLPELVQALSGCSIERAELAVSDPIPDGPVSPEDALSTTARALVQLRSRRASTARQTV